MTTPIRAFRFGVVNNAADAASWRATARRVEELGFHHWAPTDGIAMLDDVSVRSLLWLDERALMKVAVAVGARSVTASSSLSRVAAW